MKKHTLLATTGASPQVVTETLYAIHQANQLWPDDIYLITTSFGKGKAIKGLIEDGHLQRLCEELNRPMPAFDAMHVLVTPGADGTEVEDARSLADHEALANFIMTQVRDRTSKPDASLHASLAGGRKTMTFYIGYAMSLFGRVQDTLSHVLVSDGYEGPNDFYFPTQQSRPVLYVGGPKDGQAVCDAQRTPLDAKNASITLAMIPFVRLRDGLPEALHNGTVSFIDTVIAIQKSFEPARLEIFRELVDKKPIVKCGDQRIKLPPLQLAWIVWWAERAKNKKHTLAPSEKDVSSNLSAQRFLQIYGNIVAPTKIPFLQSSDRQIISYKNSQYASMETHLADGIHKKFFEQGISKLEKLLKEELGQYQAARYMIQRNKSYGQTRYSLDIDPDSIHIDLE